LAANSEAAARYDPVFLAPEVYDFTARICVRDGKGPQCFYVKGHNHISEISSIGSPDDQLARWWILSARAIEVGS
jgi:hypothetical protein